MDLPLHLISGFAAALGVGMLIGVERERRKGDGPTRAAAGVRTHALLALLGAVAVLLGPPALVMSGAAAAALAVASYLRSAHQDPGLTGEVAMLVTFVLGALAQSEPALAAALGVVVALLLASKNALHRLTRELMSEREMRDLLVLAAAMLIVLPLLPVEPVDPWGVLRPSSLGRLVVLVMAIGAAGHITMRLVGARWGLPIAGFFAGFASSTAATAGFGQRARADPGVRIYAVAATLFANLASLLLLVVVVASIAPTLVVHARWTLGAAAATLFAVGELGLWHAPHDDDALPPAPEARAFRLSHALLFAALVALIVLASAWLTELYGDRAALVAASVAALVELHAAAASIAQLATSASLPLGIARWGLVAMLASSALAKSLLAFASGGRGYGWRVSAGLLASVLAAAGATLLTSATPG